MNAYAPQPTYRGRIKYDRATAAAYQHGRSAARQRAELRLLDRALNLVPAGDSLLDLPCGGARLSVHAARRGYRVTAADLSAAMLELARDTLRSANLSCPVHQQDIERLSYADRAFGTVLCFRLFHHFPSPEIRQRAVGELCRVAGERVLLSYFSPWSVTSLRRALRVLLGGRRSQKHATPLTDVAAAFEREGFVLVRDFAQTPLLHTLHLAVFERRPVTPAR